MFSEKELKEFKEIACLYSKVKKLIIFCEENHDEFKSNLHVVKELRDSFDHLMRIFAIKFELKEIEDVERRDEYIELNMAKIYGHVYRAGYDSLDYASLILRDKINKEMSSFSPSAIQAAIPDYYSNMRPSVEKITSEIVNFRLDKDVADSSPEQFTQYVENVEQLNKIFDDIVKAKPSLIEYSKKQGNEKRNDIIFGIIAGIIIGIILYLIKLYYFPTT